MADNSIAQHHDGDEGKKKRIAHGDHVGNHHLQREAQHHPVDRTPTNVASAASGSELIDHVAHKIATAHPDAAKLMTEASTNKGTIKLSREAEQIVLALEQAAQTALNRSKQV